MFNSLSRFSTTCLLSASTLATALGTSSIATQAQAQETDAFMDALKGGKFSFNLRLRHEYADQDGLDESNASTGRIRLGYTTGSYEGFKAGISVQANQPLDYSEYNAAGLNGQGGKTVVADPRDANMDQLWGSYDFSQANEDIPVSVKVGRQVIAWDDQRFVGHVGWRNLWQTFDAATVKATPVDGLEINYGYIWYVSRIFGPDSGRNRSSDSHIINASYQVTDGHKLTGFAYLLDFEDDAPGASNATYGLRYAGKSALNEDIKLAYALSYATQSDYADNTTDYDADYIAGEIKGLFGASFVGGGLEILGSDDGVAGFQTPLATAHKFNGFADKYLGTPAAGLEDYYITAGTKIPSTNTGLSLTYHYFTANDNNEFYGTEIDAVIKQPINPNMVALVKIAWFDGNEGTNFSNQSDVAKAMAQLEIKF